MTPVRAALRILFAGLLALFVGASADAQTTSTSTVTTTTTEATTTSSSTLPGDLQACQFPLTAAVSTLTHDLLRCHERSLRHPAAKRVFREQVCRGEMASVYDCLAPAPAEAAGCRPAPRVCLVPEVTAARDALRNEILAGLGDDFFRRLDCGNSGKGRRKGLRCVKRLTRRLATMAANVGGCYVDLATTQFQQGLVPANAVSTCERDQRAQVLGEYVTKCPACVDATAITDEVLALVRRSVRGAFAPCPFDTGTGTFCGHVNPCRREYCDGLTCQGVDLTDTLCADATACTTSICKTGVCTTQPRNEGRACDDAAPCHACAGGVCAPAVSPSFCADSNECTLDACDPDAGCVHTPRTGENCTKDADPCTDDRCGSDGNCAAVPVVCNDNNPATRDFCSDGFCHFE